SAPDDAIVDDTTLYCRDEDDVHRARRLLHKFGRASGLCLNDARTTVVPLNLDAALIGLNRSVDVEWKALDASIQTKLAMALLKTTDPLYGIRLVQQAAVPKCLYLARHSPVATYPEASEHVRLDWHF
ncbi:TPA: hypothetical protein N0F65_003248, partial [Lagenidium giganteum]